MVTGPGDKLITDLLARLGGEFDEQVKHAAEGKAGRDVSAERNRFIDDRILAILASNTAEKLAWVRLCAWLGEALSDPDVRGSREVHEFVDLLHRLASEAHLLGGVKGIFRRIRMAASAKAGRPLRVSGEDTRERVCAALQTYRGPERGRTAWLVKELSIPESTVRGAVKALVEQGRVAKSNRKRG